MYLIGLYDRPGSINNGCLHTGEAENPTAAQPVKLDASEVLIWS